MRMESRLKRAKRVRILALVCGSLIGAVQADAVVRHYDANGTGAGTGTAWLTVNNWDLNTTFAGTYAGVASPPGGSASDEARFDIGLGISGMGLNFATVKADGTGIFQIGAITSSLTTLSGSNTVFTVGGSSATGGTFQLGGLSVATGATGGTIANVVAAINDGATKDLTLQSAGVTGGTGTVIFQLGNANAAMYVTSGRVLRINSALTELNTGTVLNKSGAGTLTLNASNTFTGGMNVLGGTVRILSTGGMGTSGTSASPIVTTISDGAMLQFGSGTVSYGTGRNIALNGLSTLNIEASSVTSFSGAFTGSGGTLVKTGDGTLSLAGSNTFGGGINVTAGTLQYTTTSAIPAGTIALSGGSVFKYVNTVATASLGSTRQFTIGTGGAFIDLSNTPTTGTQVFTLNGAIADAAGVVTPGELSKSGIGTLALANTNTYSGQTTILNGTIQVGTGSTTGTLGSGPVSLSGAAGVLALNRSDNYAVANDISGIGSVAQIGSGTSVLSGTNIYSGGTAISAGTLEFQKTASLPASGAITVAAASTAAVAVGGTGQFASADVDSFISSKATFAAGSFVGIDTASATTGFTYASAIADRTAGALGLTKIGANSLVLTGANTYTGGTNVVGGTLVVGDDASNGSIGSGAVVLSSGTTLIFDRGNDYTPPANVISGSGAVVKNGAGTLTLSAASTFTGGMTINAGTVSTSNTSSIGANVIPVALNNARLLLTNTATVGVNNTGKQIVLGSPNSTIETQSSTFIINGVISGTGTLNKAGSAALSLTAGNTYQGGTVISAGTVNIGTNGVNTGAFGTSGVINNGTVGFTATAANGSVTIGNAISGSGNLTKTGAAKVLLTGSNSYAGGSSISAGTLLSNGTGSLGSGLTTVSGTSSTAGGTLGGTGSTGGPVAVNSFGTITAGTGAASTDLAGSLATGDQTWNSGGTYVWKVASGTGTAGTDWDTLSMGNLTVASTSSNTFTVRAIIGSGGSFSSLTPGTQYQIASYTSLSGFTPGTSNVSDYFTLDTTALSLPAMSASLVFAPADASAPNGAGGIYLDYEPAPEPTTALLFGLGSTGLLASRRRRQPGTVGVWTTALRSLRLAR